MKPIHLAGHLAAFAAIATTPCVGAASPAGSVPVTVENFAVAETHMYFAKAVQRGSLGKLSHNRDIAEVGHQPVIRYNRDVLISTGIFDLDAGPVTVTLPDAGKRFRSLLVIDENHYNPLAAFDAGKYTLTRERIGTRYIEIAMRIFVDPNNPADLATARALQDATVVSQPGGPGKLELPAWDPVSQKKVRDALLSLGTGLKSAKGVFGTRQEVDPVRHLIGTAIGWGGNPESVAMYNNVTPSGNDGKTIYRLHVPADVLVDAFWSVSAYNAKGYFEPNPLNAYNFNNVTSRKNRDGSIDIQFGGCDGTVPNCLPVTTDWNYTVRLYRPRAALRDGSWRFPEAVPAE